MFDTASGDHITIDTLHRAKTHHARQCAEYPVLFVRTTPEGLAELCQSAGVVYNPDENGTQRIEMYVIQTR